MNCQPMEKASHEQAVTFTPGDVTVTILRKTDEWDALREEWNSLFEESPTACPPLHFEWLREWWRIYRAQDDDSLRIVVIRRSGRLIGVLPLYTPESPKLFGLRTLKFLSTGEAEHEETAAEAMDLLHAPGEAEACVKALELTLEEPDVMAWDKLELLDLTTKSPLTSLGDRKIGKARIRLDACGECNIADFTEGFENYLSKLSHKMRKQVRRLLRAVENDGMRLSVASDEESIHKFYSALISLHQGRWTGRGRPGCFAAERFTELHRHLTRAWVPTGRALLAQMEWKGEPIVVIYGFVNRGRFLFYQCGVRTEECGTVESPGLAALLLLMQFLEARAIGQFDFLKGSSSYKQRLSTRQEALVTMKAVRPGVAAVAEIVAQGGRRAAERLARAFAGASLTLGLMSSLFEQPEIYRMMEVAQMLDAGVASVLA